MNSEGHLIIPTQEEIAKACPVTLSDEQEKEIANWRAEFRNEANSSGAGNSQAPRQQEARQGTWTPPMLAPGTQAVSEADLKATFGDEILSQKPMPEGGAVATREMTLCLTEAQAAVGAQKSWRVWLHNKASKNANVPAGTFIGQGGQGTFLGLVTSSIDQDKKDFPWRYTCRTGF